MVTEKRNIRPYVLGLCFFWGLVLGFVVYRTTQSTAEITEKERAEAQAQEQARLQKLAAERAKTNNTPTVNIKKVSKEVKPPITVPELAPQLAQPVDEVANAAKSHDWRSVPQIAKVSLNPAYGLTARTSPLPLSPEKLNIRETQRRNARAEAMFMQPNPQPSRPAESTGVQRITRATSTPSRPSRPAETRTPASRPASPVKDLPMPEID